METSLDKITTLIAREIADRNLFKVEDIQVMLKMRIRDFLPVYLEEHSSQIEQKYNEVLGKQAKHGIRHPEYVKIGYELAQLKSKKAMVNRAINNVKRESKYNVLADFVKERFGEEAMREFYNYRDGLDAVKH